MSDWVESESEDDMGSMLSTSPASAFSGPPSKPHRVPRGMPAPYMMTPPHEMLEDDISFRQQLPTLANNGQQFKRVLVRGIQQDSLKLVTMQSQAVTVRGPSGSYVVYHVEITSDYCKQKWVVCKRYSEFYRLRKKLLTDLAAHRRSQGCHSCGTVLHQLKAFEFPKRMALFKEQATLVAARMAGLEAFLVALCEYLAGGDNFTVCREINAIRFMVKQFLQFPLEHEFQHVRAIRNLKYIDPRDIHVDSDACPICLCEWRELDGNQLVLSPCGHFFHENCINEWYRTRFDCPICRTIAGGNDRA